MWVNFTDPNRRVSGKLNAIRGALFFHRAFQHRSDTSVYV